MQKIFILIQVLFFMLSISSCNKLSIEELSKNYRGKKDITSLIKLSKLLRKGMTKDEVERILGTPDPYPLEDKNYYHYLTLERTLIGNSFYILTIKFKDDILADFQLSTADE